MGSLCCSCCNCCNCCKDRKGEKSLTYYKVDKKIVPSNDKKEESSDSDFLGIASIRTHTASGCPVERKIKNNLFTEKQFQEIRDNPKIDIRIKRIIEPPFTDFTKITDQLYLTSYFGLSKENITKCNIKSILTIAHELPKFQIQGIECIRLPVEDSNQEDISPYFDKISDKINENTQKNIKTVIHCMAGARRSFSFTIAYLMKYKKMNLKEAFTYVFERRRVLVAINVYFFQQLINFEKKLFGNNSAKLIEMKGMSGTIPDFIPKEFPELMVKETSIEERIPTDVRPGTGPDSNLSITSLITLEGTI